MFSYVAKALLSKTLRTFLRTYLDDINLEGINWSSVDQNAGNARQGSGSGSSNSGWGVQLSNVKLREGMELVKLPGKRKRTVIVTKQVKRNKENDKNDSSSSSKEEAVPAENDTPRASNKRKVALDRKTEAELPLLFNEPPPPPSGVDDDDDIVVNIDDNVMQQSYHRERVFNDDFSEAGYFSSNPPTPKQSRSGFCGMPAAMCRNNGNPNKVNVYKPQQCSMDQISPLGDDGQSHGSRVVSFDENSRVDNDTERGYLVHPLSDLAKDEFSYNSDQDSYVEIEEECLVEDDMALIVGSGGVIGTLNIRVVDKELHITVEDAHLILEVIPKEADPEKNVSAPSKTSKSSSYDRSNSTSSEAESAPKSGETTTIGNKVKQKSVFAKILSMIPMLFLRDCRVTLILPEELDSSKQGDEEDNTSVDDCTVFELGIDFLSVTKGDDLMDVFQRNTADTPRPKSHRRDRQSVSDESSKANSERKSRDSNYIYERRRIRTGKGPESGIWLTIQRPNASDIVYGRKKRSNYEPQLDKKWARRRFLDSSQAFCFRCSGIDFHARIVMEMRRSNIEDEENLLIDELEDYTMEMMFGTTGVDYIDPATFARHANKQKMLNEHGIVKQDVDELAVPSQSIDSNYCVETIPFPSNFHWIARNSHRSNCPTPHLPLEECVSCWSRCTEKAASSTTMDASMPLPGSVFALSITDPIELNVDRNHLDAIWFLSTMFIPPKKESDESKDVSSLSEQHIIAPEDASASSQHETTSIDTVDCNAFPSYMQPDAIYISDIHIARLIVRLQALRPRPENDFGLKFGYWEVNVSSICCEDQHVDSDELLLHDVTFHIGNLQCVEYKGTCEHSIVSVGQSTTFPSKLQKNTQSDAIITSTASQILEIPLSSVFDSEDSSCALHTRLIYRGGPRHEKQRLAQNGVATFKIGTFDVDIDQSLVGSIIAAVDETKHIILGDNGSTEGKPKESNSLSKSKAKLPWLLQVATKGGNLSYEPLVKVIIPASRYQAKQGTDGLSLDTFLNGLGIEVGPSITQKPSPTSLAPMSTLPESLRLHILLYLDDLTPLERALKIKRKKKTSAFLRSHTVSKKLSKLPQPFSSRSAAEETLRRNDLLSRLQSLDVESLEALLAIHDSFPKKTKG